MSVADHHFNVRDLKESRLLPKEQAVVFLHTVAQLPFLSAWETHDIQTAAAFLGTRVEAPNEDDWENFKSVLKYLQRTCYLKFTLTVDNIGIIKL